MKGYTKHTSEDGHVSWVPLYDKHADYAFAEAWLKAERETLESMHPKAFLYINARTLEYIAGSSFDRCAKGWAQFFGPVPPRGWLILGIPL